MRLREWEIVIAMNQFPFSSGWEAGFGEETHADFFAPYAPRKDSLVGQEIEPYCGGFPFGDEEFRPRLLSGFQHIGELDTVETGKLANQDTVDSSPETLLPKVPSQPGTRGRRRSTFTGGDKQLKFAKRISEPSPLAGSPVYVDRVGSKVVKTRLFWQRQSQLIPNVFKLAKIGDSDSNSICEHQDLSMKILMPQGISGRSFHEGSNAPDLDSSEEEPEPLHSNLSCDK